MQTSAPPDELPTRLERLRIIWRRFQVSRKGVYSLEAVQAFQTYSFKPWMKSLALLLAVPLPALAFILLLECIPLASPNAGWMENYALYLRLTGFVFIGDICCTIQLFGTHSGSAVSLRSIFFMSVMATAAQIGLAVFCGYKWAFPTPYCLVWTTMIGAPFIGLLILYVFVRHNLLSIAAYRTFAKASILLMFSQSALIVVYPAYSAIFVRLRGLEQAAFVLVLPIIKIIMKNFIANRFIAIPKEIIHTTVFSVELFNAFYVSMCMHTARSPWATVVLIVYDVLNSMWALYCIQRASQKVFELQNKLGRDEHKDLLSMVLEYVLDRPKMMLKNRSDISNEEVEGVKKSRVVPHPEQKASGVFKLSTSKRSEKETAVVPFAPTTHEAASKERHVVDGSDDRNAHNEEPVTMPDSDKALLLQQTQSLLFRCEYLASLEYVEFVVPFIYIIYMSVLYNLPNVKYHANFRHLTEETLYHSIGSIALYAGLELLSFIAFVTYIQWKFGFSPLKLLGFTFEAQGSVVIARSALILVFVTQFPYPHFGMDPTFQFDYSNYP